jgi:hypothetical protein
MNIYTVSILSKYEPKNIHLCTLIANFIKISYLNYNFDKIVYQFRNRAYSSITKTNILRCSLVVQRIMLPDVQIRCI